jgi:hypothetical protein
MRAAGSLLFLFGFLLWPHTAHTRQGEDISSDPRSIRRFTITRATSEITIDGNLAESAWDNATVIDLPYERFPRENVPPPVQTECHVTYDDNYLYFGFRAYDPEPEKIRAHLMDRDQIFTFVQDDYVGFMLDTFNDQRRAFQFRINPLGVQAEALNSGFSEDWEWDLIWDSAGQITDEGYTVEVAVPFNQLRFPRSDGSLTFGFSAMRSWPRSVRHRISSNYTDFNDACWMCQYNKITGFESLSPGKNIELDPTLTSSRTDRREEFPDGTLEKGDVEVEPGLTARWGITPNMTLTGTVNPDFSQVEADVAQLEVNERFALFFPEKRPFFLEGVDYFHTPFNAVFTRTVADPAWGAKLTGKVGANGLGVFLTRDRINNLVIPSNQFSRFDSVEQDVDGGVFRYRRDIGRSSSIGAIYTGRDATDYHNRVAGVDGRVQVASADTVHFQYLYSDTLYPEEVAERQGQSLEAFGGRALSVNYNHSTRNWSWSVFYEDFSPAFRADFGFIPRVDTRTVEARYSGTLWANRNTWWVSFRCGPRIRRTVDHNGTLTDQRAEIQGTFQGLLQTQLFVSASVNKEYFNGVTFDLSQLFFAYEMQPSGSMKLSLTGIMGDEIDSFNTQKGDLLNLRPGIELKLGRHVNLDLSHSYQRLDVPGGRLFEENLSEARIYYYLNVRTLLRLIAQYRNVENDPSLFPNPVAPESERLFLQALFSYKLNPRTVVFLGYSDNKTGRGNFDLTQTDRTFFLKLGYAWTM